MSARVKIGNTGNYLEVQDSDLSTCAVAVGFLFSPRPVAPSWTASLGKISHYNFGVIAEQSNEYDVRNIGPMRDRIVSRIPPTVRYLLFLDDDVELPPFGLDKLVLALQSNPNAWVCGAVYYRKSEPLSPLIWDASLKPITPKDKFPFPCAAVGGGCMLIRTESFGVIPKPRFQMTENGDDDDIYFCSAVRNQGKEVLAHGGVVCRHWDVLKNGFWIG